MCISSLGCQRSTYIVFTQGCGCTYVSEMACLISASFPFCTLYMGVCTTVAFFLCTRSSIKISPSKYKHSTAAQSKTVQYTYKFIYYFHLLYIWQIENKHTMGATEREFIYMGLISSVCSYSVGTKFTKCRGHR